MCATLFNIGHIHLQNKERQQALDTWISVHQLATAMQLSQALEALENLAESLGLEDGLAGWEKLAESIKDTT